MSDQHEEPGFFTRIYREFVKSETIQKDENPLRIGVLGAARIAPMALIQPAAQMKNVVVTSVAARDTKKAQDYARKHKILGTHEDYQSLLEDPNIDAIYNPLPNGLHYEWTKKALQGFLLKAGKHVLLEKPSTSNADQTKELFQLAKEKNLVLMEAIHYRHHPATLRLKEILRSGEIGKVKLVEANMTFPPFFKDDDIRFNYELAGGSFMDEGCYVTSLARFIVGEDPTSVSRAEATLIRDKVDVAMDATLQFPSGAIANLKTAFNGSWIGLGKMIPKATIVGETGSIQFSNWLAPHAWHKIVVEPQGKPSRTEKIYHEGWSTYRYQLESFVSKVAGKEPKSWVHPEDSIGNISAIDMVYEKSGLGKRI